MRIKCKTGEPTIASDGLLARCVGQWSKDKVSYISLTLAVIDPTGLHFHFDSLRTLTKNGRKVDIISLFPDGMDVRRNLESYLEKDPSEIDEVLGTRSWRDAIKEELRNYPGADDAKCPGATRIVFKIFKNQLEKLGYPFVTQGDEIRFKNSRKADLYYLVFASRHQTGHEFWQKIQVIEPSGQRKIPF